MGLVFVIFASVHAGVYIQSTVMDTWQTPISHLFSIRDPKGDLAIAGGQIGPNHNLDNKMPYYDDDGYLIWGGSRWMCMMGFYGTLFLTPPLILSLPPIRRYAYNLFYFAHLTLHVGVIFLWFHSASVFYYLLPGMGFYAIDIAVRLYHRFAPVKVISTSNTYYPLSGLTGHLRARSYFHFIIILRNLSSQVARVVKEPGPLGFVRVDIDATKSPELQQYEPVRVAPVLPVWSVWPY
jgi:Ferric reductase like transmembrane component